MKKAYVVVKRSENSEVLKPIKEANEWELYNLPRVLIDTHTRERKEVPIDDLLNMDWEYVLGPTKRQDYKTYTIQDSMSRFL